MNIWAFLFSGMIAYVGFRRLKLTPAFPFEKTAETIGTVTEIKWIYGEKGSYIQSVTYEFRVGGQIYCDKFTIGRKKAKRKIGDCLLLKYCVKKPQKHEIIGMSRNPQLTDTKTIGSSEGNAENRHF